MLLLSGQELEAMQFTQLLLQLGHFNEDYLRRKTEAKLMLIKIPPTHGFFDESGKFSDQDVICICGFLSDETRWQEFMGDWLWLCHDLQLPDGLHMKTFFTEFRQRGLDETETTALLERFVDVIRKHVHIGFAIAMDTQHFKKKLKSSKGMIADPAVACLQRLLRRVRDRLQREGYQGRIIFHLDEDEQYAMAFYKTICKLRKKDDQLARLVGTVAFDDDTYARPLQAADLLANLTYRWIKDCLAGKASLSELPPLLKRLQKSPLPGYGIEYISEYWNKDELDKNWHEFVMPIPTRGETQKRAKS